MKKDSSFTNDSWKGLYNCGKHEWIETEDAGLIGGSRYSRPGEASLAHHGMLFLDELPEFKRHVVEALRQPLEDDDRITIGRAALTLTYPAHFMLVAAMNPCPCGQLTNPQRECSCTAVAVQRYCDRLSGPLLDRIDLHVGVPARPPTDRWRGRRQPVLRRDWRSCHGGQGSSA